MRISTRFVELAAIEAGSAGTSFSAGIGAGSKTGAVGVTILAAGSGSWMALGGVALTFKLASALPWAKHVPALKRSETPPIARSCFDAAMLNMKHLFIISSILF